MKKIMVFLLVICLLLSVNTFAADNYTIVEMSEFADVDNFSEGLCAVQDKVSKRWGFVDVNKNWVISPQFQSASYFKNDVCTVNTVDGETVLINRNGEIVFKCSEYNSKADSDKIFLEKHGQYKIVFENSGSDRIPYYVTLLNSNYFTITPNDVKLCAFKGGSQTLFWENNQKKIYNYKGIEITDKLSGNVDISGDKLLVNNKYVIGFGESGKKLIAFNIDGNKIAEFDTPTVDIRNISLSGDIIIIKGNYIDTLVYNIPLNKQIGTYSENDNVKTYYDKFFTVKKNNGTSALYSFDGDILVDFGKWDYIYPSSVSNNAVVAIDKYGIADFDGNLLLPLEYSRHKIQNEITSTDGKYAILTKDGTIFYNIDMATLKQDYGATYGFTVGYRYHRRDESILDNNLKTVYSANNFYNLNFLDEGRVKLYTKTNPRTYSFLIFNDGGVKIKLDNRRLEFDVLPVVQDGRTLVPMRAIFEALGADVEWNGETQTITAKNKDVTIQMQIGNNTLTKNGQSSQIDVSPQLIDGRTMVPVRAISDCFNVLVDWNGYSQTVSLFTN